jgi:hypothetical protein
MFCVALGIFSSRGPLERLTIGLAKEISIWQECNDTLLYVERREFLTAMRDAHSGIESARVALVNPPTVSPPWLV